MLRKLYLTTVLPTQWRSRSNARVTFQSSAKVHSNTPRICSAQSIGVQECIFMTYIFHKHINQKMEYRLTDYMTRVEQPPTQHSIE